jgi:hypothetical protein
MSQLTVNDRNQMDRATLSDTGGLRRTTPLGQKLLITYSIVGTLVLALLTVAAVALFNGWPHLIVIADGILVFFLMAYWTWPQRKRIY